MSGKPIPPLQTQSQSDTRNSPDPLFNPETHTQGGLPHLVDFLVAEYRRTIQEANERRAAARKDLLDPEAALRSARPLLDFFKAYLRMHRPIQAFPIDTNYGIVLSNNAHLAISPGMPHFQGTMQDSGAVHVSRGATQPGQEGVVPVHDIQM